MCNNSIFTKEQRADLLNILFEFRMEEMTTQCIETIVLQGYDCKGLENFSDEELLRLSKFYGLDLDEFFENK
jgi:hypothetical protein